MITMSETNQSTQALQQVMKTGNFDTTKLDNETAQVLHDGLENSELSFSIGAQECHQETEKLSDYVALKDIVSLEDIHTSAHQYSSGMYVVPKGYEVDDGNRVGQWMLQDKQTYENLQVPKGTVIIRDQEQHLFGSTPIIGG